MTETVGRARAIENTFIRVGSRPEEYEPDSLANFKIWKKTSQCELCGQHIAYDFLLKHKTSPDKNLHVGSDCLLNHVRVYMPDIVSTMLRKMEMLMEKLVEEERAIQFAAEYPTFLADLARLQKSVQDILSENKVRWDFASGKLMLPIFDTISSVSNDMRKKKFTTTPKADKIIEELKVVDSGKFAELIMEYAQAKELGDKRPTIEDETSGKKSKAQREFYDLYLANAKYMNWDNSATVESKSLTKIEKSIFLSSLEQYNGKRLRNKKKLVKDKGKVLDALESTLIDGLKTRPIEDHDRTYLQRHNETEENIELLKKSTSIWSGLQDTYKITLLAKEYGLVEIQKTLRLSAENIFTSAGEIGTRYNYAILFKSDSESDEFIKNLRLVYRKVISNFENFVDSDTLVSDVCY
jgi:hypothetical protein